jgi:hypothetical protein
VGAAYARTQFIEDEMMVSPSRRNLRNAILGQRMGPSHVVKSHRDLLRIIALEVTPCLL